MSDSLSERPADEPVGDKPVADEPALTIDAELAARLTLFFLRGRVPAHWTLRDEAFAFGLGEKPLATYDAVQRLVESPKPFVCWGEMDGDVLVVQTRRPPSMPWLFSPDALKAVSSSIADTEQEEFRDRWRDVKALCLGRGEWQVLTLGELAAWNRQYQFAGGFSWSRIAIDALDDRQLERHDVPPEALVEAAAQGAVVLYDYYSARSHVTPSVHVAITRIEPGTRPSRLCERCRERDARFTVEWLGDEHPPRHFCQRCIDAVPDEDDVLPSFYFDEGRGMERERMDLSITEMTGTPAELAARAEALAFMWAMRDAPPFIRDFIDRYRAP